MNETNAIAEVVDVVVSTHATVSGIDRTTIILAGIQSLTLILTAVIGVITRIIWRDVNSDRTARIKEVQALNAQLTVVEKLNTFLETQAGGSSPPKTVPTPPPGYTPSL